MDRLTDFGISVIRSTDLKYWSWWEVNGGIIFKYSDGDGSVSRNRFFGNSVNQSTDFIDLDEKSVEDVDSSDDYRLYPNHYGYGAPITVYFG